ncbi:MAG: hypothetical protein K9M99_08325 [Candidatus Cloacimonetes bacterium]|nr:hypothetical protein [Candidatus Cloacimonadota bacterium]
MKRYPESFYNNEKDILLEESNHKLKKKNMVLNGNSYNDDGSVLKTFSLDNIDFFVLVTYLLLFLGLILILRLNYLASDPYMNWLEVDAQKNNDELINVVNEIGENYDVKSLSEYNICNTSFYSEYKGGLSLTRGRTIDIDEDSVYEVISRKSNIVYGEPYFSSKDIGIIITEKTYSKYFGKDKYKDNGFLYVYYKRNENPQKCQCSPLPIRAIVKELPSKTEFLLTNFCYNHLYGSCNIFDVKKIVNKFSFFIPFESIPKENQFELENIINKKIIENKNFNSILSESFDIEIKNFLIEEYSMKSGFIVNVMLNSTSGKKKISLTGKEHHEINQMVAKELSEYDIDLIYDYDWSEEPSQVSSDYLSINFKSVNNLKSFVNDVLTPSGYSVDTSQIAMRELYYGVIVFSIVVFIIIIIFASIVLATLYTQIFTARIKHIKHILGSLIAFGTSNHTIISMYRDIFTEVYAKNCRKKFIAVTILFIISFVIARIYIIQHIIVLDYLYALIFVMQYFLTKIILQKRLNKTLHSLLNHTPGELVYSK